MDLLNPLETAQAKYCALVERYHDLALLYYNLKDAYATSLGNADRTSVQLQQYKKELSDHKARANKLEEMNRYLTGRMEEQKASFDRAMFTLNDKIEHLEEYYQTAYTEALAAEQRKFQEQYETLLGEQQKPYREYFFNTYGQKE